MSCVLRENPDFVEENAPNEVFILTRKRHSAPKPPTMPVDGAGGITEGEIKQNMQPQNNNL